MLRVTAALAAGPIVLLAAGSATAGAQLPETFTIPQVMSAPFPTELVTSSRGDVAWTADAQGHKNVWVATAPDWRGHPITPWNEDTGEEITSPRWLPDGRALVFVRGSGTNDQGYHANAALDPRGTKRLVMFVNADGTGLRSLAEGSSPSVSPDGKTIAFERDGAVWTVPVGGDSAAARRLFVGRGRDVQLRWSPRGDAIAFTSARGDHGFVGVYHIAEHRLVYLDPSVDTDAQPVWSPDGASIAFVRQPAHTRTPVHETRRAALVPWSIRVADASTGKGREIWRATSRVAGSFFHGIEADNQLLWSRDGRIVFPWERGGWVHLYSISSSGVAPGGASHATPLTPGSAFEVQEMHLSRDRDSVLYTSNQGDVDRRHVWIVAAAGGAPRELTPGTGIEWEVSEIGPGAIAFLHSDAINPPRAAVSRSGTVTELADAAIPATFPRASLVAPRQVLFRATDGLELHGQLFLPPAGAAQRHAAIIFFHGGSRRQMVLGWNPMGYYTYAYALNQYLTSRGYVVLSVNYRSGIGYGMNFREALDYGPSGATEARDIGGAVAYLKSRPDVDPGRLGVWGGSYGGYMTALSLARYPDDFRVGVDYAGVHDWNLEWRRFIDTWDETREMQLRRLAYASSPMSDLSKWRAPVLLIQGDDDRNVVFSQTVQLAEDLRARHVPVETLVYPDETHEFLLFRDWVGSYEATAAFLERYLR